MRKVLTEEEARALIERFAEKQQGGHFACPRCGMMTMSGDAKRNALSRRANVYGEPFAIPLDLLDIKLDDDFADLAGQPTIRVDGLEAKHLVQDNVIGTVRLRHEIIDCVTGHEALFELHPVISFACCHTFTALERQIAIIIVDFRKHLAGCRGCIRLSLRSAGLRG